MREVPAVLFGFMRATFERAGVDVAACLDGLPLAQIEPSLGQRVDWNDLAEFLNRCARGMSDEEQERLGESYVSDNRYLLLILRALHAPRLVHSVAWRASRPAFPHMDIGYTELADGRLRIHMQLPDRFAACPVFFRGTVGECRAITERLGLGPSQVEADVGPRHGTYLVRLPPHESRIDSAIREAQDVGEGLASHLSALYHFFLGHDDAGPLEIDDLRREHGLTRAEARVAVRLAEGATVMEIADELAIQVDTVRTHLKRTYAKTNVRGQVELTRLVLGATD